MGLTHFGFGYEGNCVVPFYDSVMYLCDTKVEMTDRPLSLYMKIIMYLYY